MAKQQTIFTETTEVSVEKSIGEIMGLLVRAGATSINQELDSGQVIGLSFVIPVSGGCIPYKLPVRIEPVFQKLNGRRDRYGQWSQSTMAKKDREQAARVAWRQLYWWLKSQLALIDLGMVETAEVLLPYMLASDGRSFFDTYKPRLLAAPADPN
jgi:hypothetical protein